MDLELLQVLVLHVLSTVPAPAVVDTLARNSLAKLRHRLEQAPSELASAHAVEPPAAWAEALAASLEKAEELSPSPAAPAR